MYEWEIGEKRKFSFGSFVVEKKVIDIHFQYTEHGRFFNIIKLYLMKGLKGPDIYVGVSDKGHLLKLPEDKASKYLRG